MPNLFELTFAWPWLILALPLAGLVWWRLPAGIVQAPRVPFADTWQAASLNSKTQQLLRPRPLLVLLSWVLLVMALMRPQIPGDRSDLLLSGRQMMLLVDLSLSMSIEDMTTSGVQADRLAAAKSTLNEFIPQRDGDQMGLIVFGSQAFVHVPVTPDLAMVQQLANEMEIGMAGSRTALGEAVALGVIHLTETRDDTAGDQVMVLLSDGAQTIGNVFPPEAGILARDNDIRIYSIGFGSDGGGTQGSSADLDEPALRMLADSTGGDYFRARSTRDLNDIYRAIDALEPTDAGLRTVRHARDIFYWPAGLAFALLLALNTVPATGPAQWLRVPGRRRHEQTDEGTS